MAICIDLTTSAAEVTKLVTFATSAPTFSVGAALGSALAAHTTTRHLLKMDADFVIDNDAHHGSVASTWSKFHLGDFRPWNKFTLLKAGKRRAWCDGTGLSRPAWVSGDGAFDVEVLPWKKGGTGDWRENRDHGVAQWPALLGDIRAQ